MSTKSKTSRFAAQQLVKNIVKEHQILAIKMLFAEEHLAVFHINSQCNSLGEDLIGAGIVQIDNEGKLQFIHRTFAEFYVADYFVKELTKDSNISQQILDFLLNKIFLEEEYRVIRAFIDGMLSRCEPTNEAKKQFGNRIHDLGRYGVLSLHRSALEGNANVIGLLLVSVQVAEHADSLVKLLLVQNFFGDTAWHEAAHQGKLETLEKLSEYAKEILNTDGLNNLLLLFVKDCAEHTVLHHATYSGNVQILERIWNLAEEQLSPEELKKLL